ncbi:MAG: regulatory protein RecX [Deinococcales bacterium]
MARRTPLDPERAWSYLLDLLARRDYTAAELRDRLRRRGIDGAEADALLTRLGRLDLVDDARFAERWVEGRRHTRGRLALRAELGHKGVATELVERELVALTEQQQLTAATALLERFAWRYQPVAAPGTAANAGRHAHPSGPRAAADGARAPRQALRERARAFAFLARRGFTPDVAGAAIDAVGWWREDDG